LQPEATPDPDRPHWGPITGIGVWLFSVAAIIVVPAVAVIAWYMLDMQRGLDVPLWTEREALLEYVQSARLIAVQIYSTIIAHLLTLGVCWVVVTRLKRYPFLKSLGWNWAGWPGILWLDVLNLRRIIYFSLIDRDFELQNLVTEGPPFRRNVVVNDIFISIYSICDREVFLNVQEVVLG
jgi:hypothetical protein